MHKHLRVPVGVTSLKIATTRVKDMSLAANQDNLHVPDEKPRILMITLDRLGRSKSLHHVLYYYTLNFCSKFMFIKQSILRLELGKRKKPFTPL